MHIAVMPVFRASGMAAEIVLPAVFEDKHTAGIQQVFFENTLGKRVHTGKVVRRIGKNNVVVHRADVWEIKCIEP